MDELTKLVDDLKPYVSLLVFFVPLFPPLWGYLGRRLRSSLGLPILEAELKKNTEAQNNLAKVVQGVEKQVKDQATIQRRHERNGRHLPAQTRQRRAQE